MNVVITEDLKGPVVHHAAYASMLTLSTSLFCSGIFKAHALAMIPLIGHVHPR